MNPPSALQDVVWDLDHLVAGPTGVDEALDEASELATAFAGTYRGALAEIDSAGLAEAMQTLAKINDLVGRAGSYAQLRFSTDTADPERGALMQRVEERGTALETMLLFFELEWAALDDDRADELLAGDGLEFCTHYLRTARRYRPHLLTEPEERIFSEKALTGRSAWGRLFEELTSSLEVELEETVTLDMALSRLAAPDREVRRSAAEAVTKALQPGLRTRAFVFNTLLADPDRQVRRSAAEAVTKALQPGLRTRAFVFNTLLADKATDDRLRHYPNWLSGRNLANEASDESVAALIEAVRGRYGLARRWYTLKAGMLGIDKLADYDRMAPVSTEDVRVDWAQATEMVLDAYSSFSPRLGNLVGRFFDEGWIDAPPGPRKRGGAFCAYTVPSVHPYVMLNFTGRRRDVLTLAHELGHGVHAALAAEQGIYHQHTPLTLAETASVFGEALTFGRLLDAAPTPASRLALLAEDIEGAIATVFRQVAMNRFESLVHTDRRENGELAVDRFNELWVQSQTELLGESVEITDGYHSWWSYVPHFINVPGYVYAYAYGQLLALSVYQRYLEEGGGFAEKYLGLLAAGGSRSPQELGALVGIDLADPGFWDSGLDLVQRQLEAAEAAAADVH